MQVFRNSVDFYTSPGDHGPLTFLNFSATKNLVPSSSSLLPYLVQHKRYSQVGGAGEDTFISQNRMFF